MKSAPLSLPLLLLSALSGAVPVAHADHCGPAQCGGGGSCREQSLIARCDCDAAWVSVTTHLGGGSQGAFCVPIPADPQSETCEGLACGPNGACVESSDAPADARFGGCICDPGYRRAGNGCEDDPDDDSEAPCRDVRCGEGATCMVTPDGATCRCKAGEFVVLGLDARGELGPVCQAPANPASACGPEACGGAGICVISQAAFCRCDAGYSVTELPAPDGRMRPYCVDGDGNYPAPAEGEGEGAATASGGEDAGEVPRAAQQGCASVGPVAGPSWWPRR